MNRPIGLSAVKAIFGDLDDPNFEDHHIISVSHIPYPMYYRDNPSKPWKKVTSLRCHELIAPQLIQALTAVWVYARKQVKATVGYDKTSEEYDDLTEDWLHNEFLEEYGGSYEPRTVRGSSAISMHSFGIAFDICPERYRLGSTTRLPEWYVKCWTDAGFFYGGDFQHRKDPMHFQFAEGC